MNAEADIPVKSEHQGSFLSIITFTVILHSLENILTPRTHETKNMRSLDIQQSLVIHCLCIDDITVYLAE